MLLNIMLIGLGPHAKRIYIPAIKNNPNLNLIGIVELEENIRSCIDFANKANIKDITFIGTKATLGFIEEKTEIELKKIVKENNVRGVIIATEPLVHKQYALWALKQNLNILMDKPVTTRAFVTTSLIEAQNLYQDFQDLYSEYSNKKEETCFIVNVQRRYHPGFLYVKQKITEIAKLTNCPVTSIYSSHCDGQWRLPNEIITQDYHPYNTGYGKVSHSGYHIIDAVTEIVKTGVNYSKNKKITNCETNSNFIYPKDFIQQLTIEEHRKILKAGITEINQEDFESIYENYGEIDAFSQIRFNNDKGTICSATIDLKHNSFARRYWSQPGVDLYKGNGRVKHEFHNIQQGPFQNIQVHSFQSKDKHKVNNEEDFNVGGNNHFEIRVFRNIDITSGEKPLEIININEILDFNTDKLVIEEIKHTVVDEFASYMLGNITVEDITSNLNTHSLNCRLMSDIYISAIKYRNKGNNIVFRDLGDDLEI